MRLFLFLYILLISINGYSQKQGNNWYFGKNIGLSFNQNPPAHISQIAAGMVEGSSVVSDAAGNLLFYSNGTKVINRYKQVMLNGNGIAGNVSSTCNSVIVPFPGNGNIYYLFTVGAAGYDDEGFRYSVIDMREDNGKGAVIQKNVLIHANSFEKIAAVRHCNNRDTWIIIRDWGTDAYHSYLLTSMGLNMIPVISNSGLTVGGYVNNALGALKFNPAGTKLVAVHSFETDGAELMDFNKTTGAISNFIFFNPLTEPPAGSFTGVYGAEFSPNGQLLYISSHHNPAMPSVLYQFNISNHSTASIEASRQLISVNQPWFGGGLQAGPDGKIYFSMYEDSGLSVINDPNVQGPGCNFVFNQHMFQGGNVKPVQLGLPNFIAGYSEPVYAPYDFYINRIGDCTETSVQFRLSREDGIDSVKWDFGDNNFSTEFNPTHTYQTSGNFNILLTIFKPDCSGNFHTLSRQITVGAAAESVKLPEDSVSCSFRPFRIYAETIASGTFLWSTGETSNTITLQQPGLYWVDFTANGCTLRDSFNFKLNAGDLIDLGNDTAICTNQPLTLNAGAGRPSYLWSTGETTRMIRVNTPGLYWVQAGQSNGCEISDTIKISWGDCGVYLPSAFTPNGDGRNESFGLISGFEYRELELLVYNRYGDIIFRSAGYPQKWDGTFKGKAQPIGVYPWTLIYRDKRNFRQTRTGTVLLIR